MIELLNKHSSALFDAALTVEMFSARDKDGFLHPEIVKAVQLIRNAQRALEREMSSLQDKKSSRRGHDFSY